MRVVVAGWVAGFPVAGFFWHHVSFALGFAELGHDVYFLDDGGDHPTGFDPEARADDPERRAGIAFVAAEMDAVGLGDRWAVRHVPRGEFHGMDREKTMEVLAHADAFVNLSLATPLRPEYARIPHRLGIDTDPVFTQIKVARDTRDRALVETHTRLFSFGRPPLPASAHDWLPTRQPVVEASWPRQSTPGPDAPFTTITAWQAYGSDSWNGAEYGVKDRSLLEHLSLPSLTRHPLVMGLGGGQTPPGTADTLRAAGWEVANGVSASRSTARYRDFIASSTGEIGFAKHGYVAARSGWFSDRTCSYLASGRPAVVQDTGWTDWLPEGDGLLSFRTTTGAAEALERVAADLPRHSAAARKIAEEHFGAARVCAELLHAL